MRSRLTALGSAVALALTLCAVGAPATSAAPVTPVPVRVVGGPGHAGLYGWGLTTMQDGSVLVGDYWNLRVSHFAKDGTSLGTFIDNNGFGAGQHQSPYGMATDPRNGDIYFTDTDRYTIDKYDKLGNFIREWGSQGSGVGKFLYPSRVAVRSDGVVYVADTWENSIVLDDENGNELGTFGSFGTGPGQFKQPHGLAFDSQDRLWVVDKGNYRIQVFDTRANNQVVLQFGSQGTANGQFAGDMRGIAIDQAMGWVYIVDGEGNRVHKYDTNGNFLLKWGGNGTGNGKFQDGGREITVDGDHNVWVGDMPNFRAQKFDPNGTFLLSVPTPSAPPPPGGLNGPRGVAVDASGNIFVSDTYNWRISKYDAAGQYIKSWGNRGRAPYEFNYVRLIAIDPTDQGLVLADTDNHDIKKYSNDGVFMWETGGLGSTLTTFRNPHAVTVDRNGRVAVADSQNKRVVILKNDGSADFAFGSAGTGNGQFTFPRGITTDPVDNSIWVADSGRDIIQHFSPTGQYLGKVGSKGTADNQLDAPFDLEVDTQNVYVADAGQHKVKVFAKSGTFVTAFGSKGTTLGKLWLPQGLELVGDRLYVSEQQNDRIQEFSLSGGTFTTDTKAPGSTFASPVANQQFPVGQPIVMSGTATDNAAVGTVKVGIKNTKTALWWAGGTTWGTFRTYTAEVAAPTTSNTAWTFVWVPPTPGTYSVQLTTTDTSGNVGSPKPAVTFKVV